VVSYAWRVTDPTLSLPLSGGADAS
jgi:hypothetical protein